MPRAKFAAKSESPMTAMRDSGFFGSSFCDAFAASVAGAGASGAGAETATPIEIGPCLSPWSALRATSPFDRSWLLLVSAQLRALGSVIGCGDRPFVPALAGVTALVQITPQHLDLTGQEISLRAAHDDDRRVGGDILLLCEHQLLGPVVVPAERRRNSAVAFPFRRDRILLAVTLHEIDLLLLAGHGLDQSVRQVLLGIG